MAEIDLEALKPENALFQPEGRAVWVASGLVYRALYGREQKAQARVEVLEARIEALADQYDKWGENPTEPGGHAGDEYDRGCDETYAHAGVAIRSLLNKEATDEPA